MELSKVLDDVAISTIMRKDIVKIEPNQNLSDALNLMSRYGIRHLPVVENDRLVGVISDRDLKSAQISPELYPDKQAESDKKMERTKVRKLMSPWPETIAADDSIKSAAQKLLRHKIGSLPVVSPLEECDFIVGIVTETDLLRYMVGE